MSVKPRSSSEMMAIDDLLIYYGVCKGCLICIEECPRPAIHLVWEAEV